MLKRLWVLIHLGFMSCFVLAEKIPVNIHVDDNYKPYSYKSVSGSAAGVYIDVLQTIFDKMGRYKVVMVPVPWARGKSLMEAGEGYGLAPVFFHGHDWGYLYPYTLHFFEERIGVFCRIGISPRSRKDWPWSFRDLHVVNMKGFDGWGGKAFRDLVEKKHIQYTELNGVDKTIQLVALKRADCLLAEEGSFNAHYWKMKPETSEKSEPLVKALTVGVDPVHIGFSAVALKAKKYPFHEDFKRQFDVQLYNINHKDIAGLQNAFSYKKPFKISYLC